MVRTSFTPNAVASVVAIVASLVAAVALSQPAIVAFCVPFLASMIAGTERHQASPLLVSLASEHGRVVEGDEVTLIASITSETDIGRCTVELDPGRRLQLVSSPRVTVQLAAGETVQVPFIVKVVRWGLIRPDSLSVHTEDLFSFWSRSYTFAISEEFRASLPALALRETIEPGRYRQIAGGHRSETRGEGLELADIREYRSGDPIKSINWRISNRRREPWVTMRHPDRSATVVIVADTFDATFSRTAEPGVVRAVEALAATHLALHDRVGAVLLGAEVQWIAPQLGQRQKYRITDAFIDSTKWKKNYGPRPDLQRLIGRDAVVIVVSTLRDRRILENIAELRAGGRRLAVLEPLVVVDDDPSTGEPLSPHVSRAARLDQLERETTRQMLRRSGLLVVPWIIGTPLDPAMRTLRIVYGAAQGGSLSASRVGAMR